VDGLSAVGVTLHEELVEGAALPKKLLLDDRSRVAV